MGPCIIGKKDQIKQLNSQHIPNQEVEPNNHVQFDFQKNRNFQSKKKIKIIQRLVKLKEQDYYPDLVHWGVRCSKCFNINIKPRYHCIQCKENFCQNCAFLQAQRHWNHQIIKFIRRLNKQQEKCLQLGDTKGLSYKLKKSKCNFCGTYPNDMIYQVMMEKLILSCKQCFKNKDIKSIRYCLYQDKFIRDQKTQFFAPNKGTHIYNLIRSVKKAHQFGISPLYFDSIKSVDSLIYFPQSRDYKLNDEIQDIIRLGQVLKTQEQGQQLGQICTLPQFQKIRPNSKELLDLLENCQI